MADDTTIPLVDEERPRPPRLVGNVIVREEEDEAIDSLLAELFMHALACSRAFGDFHLAISAPASIEPVLRRMMYDPATREMPWTRTRLWVVDDVCVPMDDERSRSGRVRDFIAAHSGIPEQQFHPVQRSRTAEAAAVVAERYESELREALGWREKGHDRLDYVLLVLDERGSVAGLDRASVGATGGEGRLVVDVEGAGDVGGVSMSLSLINAARFVGVLAIGAGARASVAAMGRRTPESATWPAARLRPLAGELHWYMGRQACEAAEQG